MNALSSLLINSKKLKFNSGSKIISSSLGIVSEEILMRNTFIKNTFNTCTLNPDEPFLEVIFINYYSDQFENFNKTEIFG